jgi:hypothetical protein
MTHFLMVQLFLFGEIGVSGTKRKIAIRFARVDKIIVEFRDNPNCHGRRAPMNFAHPNTRSQNPGQDKS